LGSITAFSTQSTAGSCRPKSANGWRRRHLFCSIRPLTRGEVGCAASHFALIRELAGEAHDFVCVIEDDAIPLSVIFSSRRRLRRCRNSMLRMVSDPARWRMPAWQVARVHDRGIYAMAHRECAARNAI